MGKSSLSQFVEDIHLAFDVGTISHLSHLRSQVRPNIHQLTFSFSVPVSQEMLDNLTRYLSTQCAGVVHVTTSNTLVDIWHETTVT